MSVVQAAAIAVGMLCTFINKTILYSVFRFIVNVYMKEEASVRVN